MTSVLEGVSHEETTPKKRVKVAILDTGVREQDYQDDQAKPPGTEGIKDYKDFASNKDNERTDRTGHGSACMKLLQKVYQEAEIFVGRVFERAKATENTAQLMATVRLS